MIEFEYQIMRKRVNNKRIYKINFLKFKTNKPIRCPDLF